MQQQQQLMDQGRVSREKQEEEEERKNSQRERERETSKTELALLDDDRQGLPGVEGDGCLECSQHGSCCCWSRKQPVCGVLGRPLIHSIDVLHK